jgi:hypothetical protein
MRKNGFTVPVVLVLAISFLGACRKNTVAPPPPVIAAPSPFGFYVVGYFPAYRDPNAIPDIKFRMCNVVNYAFATVTSAGGVMVNSPTVLTTVATKAKVNGAKIFISVNGTTADFKSGVRYYRQKVLTNRSYSSLALSRFSSSRICCQAFFVGLSSSLPWLLLVLELSVSSNSTKFICLVVFASCGACNNGSFSSLILYFIKTRSNLMPFKIG